MKAMVEVEGEVGGEGMGIMDDVGSDVVEVLRGLDEGMVLDFKPSSTRILPLPASTVSTLTTAQAVGTPCVTPMGLGGNVTGSPTTRNLWVANGGSQKRSHRNSSSSAGPSARTGSSSGGRGQKRHKGLSSVSR